MQLVFVWGSAVDFADLYGCQSHLFRAVFLSRRGTPYFHAIIADLHLCVALFVRVFVIRYLQDKGSRQGLLRYMIPQPATLLQGAVMPCPHQKVCIGFKSME